MAGITLEIANKNLEIWIKAEEEVACNQSYKIGSRELTRANLKEIGERITYWNNKVISLSKANGKNRVRRIVPRDL